MAGLDEAWPPTLETMPVTKKFHPSRSTTGFTLVEVMIAVAIVGVLAAIAVPRYGNFVKRAKVSEAVAMTLEARVALESFYLKKGRFPVNQSDLAARNREVGLRAPEEYATDAVRSMWVGRQGVRGKNDTSAHVAVVIGGGVGVGRGRDHLLSTIEFTGESFKFICGDSNAVWRSSVEHEYLPKSCRN